MDSGGQSVMTTGASMMPLLCAGSWVIQLPTTHTGQYNIFHHVSAYTLYAKIHAQPPTVYLQCIHICTHTSVLICVLLAIP